MKRIAPIIAGAGLFVAAAVGTARANVVLSGPDANAGTYSTTTLAAAANVADVVKFGGLTGISVWGLLGGAPSSSPTAPVYGGITTTTPIGDNAKNAILRYYLVATGAGGQQSVLSLGEIDPSFGGGTSVNAFVAYQATGGSPLAAPSLIVPGQPGRNVSDVTSLQILSVPALPSGGGGTSTSVQLSGKVTAPGSYTLAMLQNNFTPAALNVPVTGGTDVYTGVPLWNFLNATGSSNDQIVITQATDGYEVVLALGELDPSDGGNPNDLLPYSDSLGTDFPASGIARTIFPTDNKHGRWESNLDAVTVTAAPEPGSLALVAIALIAIGTARRHASPAHPMTTRRMPCQRAHAMIKASAVTIARG